jgi:hypothetical protein
VLLLFLPPLIYYAGFYSDPRETVEHLPAVIGQSVGLVLVTAGTCAGALLLVFPDVGWAAALAFGAAVAPPDPVAATNVLQRLGVPRRLVTVLEGEGLINDGIALTVFALAVTAVGASPTAGDVGLELLVQIGGGIAIGLVVGVASTWLRRRVTDSASHVVLSLATPYLAFVPAQLVHASGVLATVTAAVWLGTRGRGVGRAHLPDADRDVLAGPERDAGGAAVRAARPAGAGHRRGGGRLPDRAAGGRGPRGAAGRGGLAADLGDGGDPAAGPAAGPGWADRGPVPAGARRAGLVRPAGCGLPGGGPVHPGWPAPTGRRSRAATC